MKNELIEALLGHLHGQEVGTLEPAPLTGDPQQADFQNRDAHRESGGLMPWRNPGDDAAARKSYTRTRDQLARDGQLEVTGGGKAVRLTPEGRAAAARLCGLPTLEDALPLMDFMAAPANDALRWTGGEFSESTLAGLSPTYGQGLGKPRLPDSALSVVDVAMPLFCAGLADWRPCNQSGLFLYSLTPEGHKLATERWAEGKAKPSAWPRVRRKFAKIKTRSAVAGEAWIDAHLEAFGARQAAAPPRPNCIQHLDPVDAPATA